MSNTPGTGNSGYGGWTPPPGQQPPVPPSVPQQPPAGGPRNAYGQPIGQPSSATPGNYRPPQPGTNAYGQPLSPQQPQVPPIVPPPSGVGGLVNAYGQTPPAPAGYGPQPGQNMYGQPPAPAKKNRKPLLIAAAIVVVVAVVGAVGWTFLGGGRSSTSPDNAASAGDTVKGYLEALAREDANGALAYSNDQPASKDFLTDEILKQQIAKWPITNIRILTDDSATAANSAIGFVQVHVAVKFGDQSSDTQISVKKEDGHWRLEHAAVSLAASDAASGNQQAANTLTLFGKPLNGNTAYVFPGFLDVGSNNQYVSVTTKPVLLDQLSIGSSSASVQATYTVTDAATTAIMNQVKAATDACSASHLESPPPPCDAQAFGIADGTVNWGPADLSRIKIQALDPYQGLQVEVTGQAFFSVTGTDMFNGGLHAPEQQTMYINGTADLTKTPLTVSLK